MCRRQRFTCHTGRSSSLRCLMRSPAIPSFKMAKSTGRRSAAWPASPLSRSSKRRPWQCRSGARRSTNCRSGWSKAPPGSSSRRHNACVGHLKPVNPFIAPLLQQGIDRATYVFQKRAELPVACGGDASVDSPHLFQPVVANWPDWSAPLAAATTPASRPRGGEQPLSILHPRAEGMRNEVL